MANHLKDLKLYYKKVRIVGGKIQKEKTLYSVNKHMIFFTTCLSVLPRIHEQSFIERKIIYITNEEYKNIKNEINLPKLTGEHSYIEIFNGTTIVLILRAEKYKEEDVIAFEKYKQEQIENAQKLKANKEQLIK